MACTQLPPWFKRWQKSVFHFSSSSVCQNKTKWPEVRALETRITSPSLQLTIKLEQGACRDQHCQHFQHFQHYQHYQHVSKALWPPSPCPSPSSASPLLHISCTGWSLTLNWSYINMYCKYFYVFCIRIPTIISIHICIFIADIALCERVVLSCLWFLSRVLTFMIKNVWGENSGILDACKILQNVLQRLHFLLTSKDVYLMCPLNLHNIEAEDSAGVGGLRGLCKS